MTAADRIFEYIKSNGKATRPEMEIALGLCERTVDTGIRKLERLGYIKRDGMTEKEWRKNRCVIFALSNVSPNLKLVGDCRGRPRLTEQETADPSAEALTNAMAAFFGRAA